MKNVKRILFVFVVMIFTQCNNSQQQPEQKTQSQQKLQQVQQNEKKVDPKRDSINKLVKYLHSAVLYSRNSDSIREYLKKNFSYPESYIVVSRYLHSDEPIKPEGYGDSLLVVKENGVWVPKIGFYDSVYTQTFFSSYEDSAVYLGLQDFSFKKEKNDSFKVFIDYKEAIYYKYIYRLFTSSISDYFPETMSFFPYIRRIGLISDTDYRVRRDSNMIYIYCDSVKEDIPFSATMFQLDEFVFGGVKSFYLEIKNKKLISEYYHFPILDIVVDYLYFEDENKDINKMQQLVFYVPRYSDTAFKYSGLDYVKEYLKIKKDFSNRF